MTLTPPLLEESLTWDEQGHLSEPAVNALADGELSIVSQAAQSHVETCLLCTNRVGRTTLLALRLSDALVQLAASPAARAVLPPEPARRRLPVELLLGALLLALLGSLPRWAEVHGSVQRLPAQLMRSLPSLVRVVVLVAHAVSRSPALAIWGWCATALLLAMGVTIARLDPRARQPLEKGAVR